MKRAAPILLSPRERAQMDRWVRGDKVPPRMAQRARIILMAADGALNHDIARELGVSRPTVQLWRQRFLAFRLEGLKKDAPRPGRSPMILAGKVRAIVEASLHTAPPKGDRWSARGMAKAQGVSEASIRRIWRQYNIKPHLFNTLPHGLDKHFIEMLYDVIGLLLRPPDNSLVICVDKRDGARELDPVRSRRLVRHDEGRATARHPERNGAARSPGTVGIRGSAGAGDNPPHQRRQAWIRFFRKVNSETPAGTDLHVIISDQGILGNPGVRAWIERHPRFHLHGVPVWIDVMMKDYIANYRHGPDGKVGQALAARNPLLVRQD